MKSRVDLVIDDSVEGRAEQNAGMGPAAVHSASANISSEPMETEAREREEEEPEEEVEGAEMAMETSVPTQDELGLAVASTPPQTPAHTYSTVVSSSMPTPAHIYSNT